MREHIADFLSAEKRTQATPGELTVNSMDYGYATGQLRLRFVGTFAIADSAVFALQPDVKELFEDISKSGWIPALVNLVGRGECEVSFSDSSYAISPRQVAEQGKMMVKQLEYSITVTWASRGRRPRSWWRSWGSN